MWTRRPWWQAREPRADDIPLIFYRDANTWSAVVSVCISSEHRSGYVRESVVMGLPTTGVHFATASSSTWRSGEYGTKQSASTSKATPVSRRSKRGSSTSPRAAGPFRARALSLCDTPVQGTVCD